jgi:hypothetical protein
VLPLTAGSLADLLGRKLPADAEPVARASGHRQRDHVRELAEGTAHAEASAAAG